MNTETFTKPVVNTLTKHKGKALSGGVASIVVAIVMQYMDVHSNRVDSKQSNSETWQEVMDLKVKVAKLEGKLGIAEEFDSTLPIITNIHYTVYRK